MGLLSELFGALASRKTFVLSEPPLKPLWERLSGAGFMVLPPGVTEEEMIEAISTSAWAVNIADAWAREVIGIDPDKEPELYERVTKAIARKVAEGFVKKRPRVSPPAPPRPRRRRR